MLVSPQCVLAHAGESTVCTDGLGLPTLISQVPKGLSSVDCHLLSFLRVLHLGKSGRRVVISSGKVNVVRLHKYTRKNPA